MTETISSDSKGELNARPSDNIIITQKFIGYSSLISKNITICGRRTSIRLEPEMWDALEDVSNREKRTIHDIASYAYLRKKPITSLTAAIRVFLLTYYRDADTQKVPSDKRVGP